MCAPSDSLDGQLADLQAKFMAKLMPTIQTHARIVFRNVRCQDKRADKVAECLALGWRWFLSLEARTKDATGFAAAFASLVAKSVRSGRRLCGMLKSKDALNEWTQQRAGFRVEPYPMSTQRSIEDIYASGGQRALDVFEMRLADNMRTPPDQQVMFRIDFADWLKTLSPRERSILKAMAQDERTKDLSKRFQLSEGRISQLRSQFKDGWRRFCGELPPSEALAESA